MAFYSLPIQLDHFFAVGSPLPLFLLMKEHECLIKKGHRGAASLLPPSICKRVHNVNHPSDPIVSHCLIGKMCVGVIIMCVGLSSGTTGESSLCQNQTCQIGFC